MFKLICTCAVLAASGMLMTNRLQAAPVPDTYAEKENKTHEGKVMSVSDGKLVMTDNDGKNEHTHKIAPTTKVTLDGKMAKLADLKKGDSIKVTTTDEDNVTVVEAKRSAK